MQCLRCKEEFEEGFDVCWNCGADTNGDLDPEFKHADASVQSNRDTLRWFAMSAGFFASMAGLFRVTFQRTASDSAPWYRRDIRIPAWLSFGVAAITLLIIAICTPASDSSRMLLFGLSGLAAIIAFVCWIVVAKTLKDMREQEGSEDLPNNIDSQSVFDFIVEAKLGGVPDDVLSEQLAKAFEIGPDAAADAVLTVRCAVALTNDGLQREFQPDTKFERLVFDLIEKYPELQLQLAGAFDDD